MTTLPNNAHQWMRRALELAQQGAFTTTPNPRVGCVIVSDSGQPIAEGFHRKAGEPHAEAMALAQLAQASVGDAARGSTAYVTLEPCSHTGRTPPCADALIRAGVSTVVVAMRDPDPRVSGQGIARLRAAGITVYEGIETEAAANLNPGFLSRVIRQRPWVRLKAALSLDGRLALANGASQWLTDEAAREDVHRWRAQACAILTGSGTVRHDNPLLNVRLPEPVERQPRRIVLDSNGKLDDHYRLWHTPGIIRCIADDAAAPATLPEHVETWRLPRNNASAISTAPTKSSATAAGDAATASSNAANTVTTLPGTQPQGLNLAALWSHCHQHQLHEIHLEAGGLLLTQILREGWADELLLYIAPRLLGADAKPLIDILGYTQLDEAPVYQWYDTTLIGNALRTRLFRHTPFELWQNWYTQS